MEEKKEAKIDLTDSELQKQILHDIENSGPSPKLAKAKAIFESLERQKKSAKPAKA